MKIYKPALIALFLLPLSSCNIYKAYERPNIKTENNYRADSNLYRQDSVLSQTDSILNDTNHLGTLPWREVFTDTKLQNLIQQGLDSNFDLRIAFLRVQEYQARLSSARMAFTPSLNLSPSGGMAGTFESSHVSYTYQVPLVASWEIDIFGRLLNAKRGAQANLLQSQAARQGVQTQIISSIATTYYALLMLDAQLAISEQTVLNWEANVRTMQSLKLSGYTNEASISQALANSFSVKAGIPEIKRQIRETENTLSLLIGLPGQPIDRGNIEEQRLPSQFSIGIPMQLFSARPDVKQAEASLMSAYAATNMARAAFYPKLTLSANGSWLNNLGNQIFNPAQFIWSALATLAQPLLNRGVNRATLRVAKAQQAEAMLSFQKTLLNAGNEVSNALFKYQSADEKIKYRLSQVENLERAVSYTQSLLTLGSSTYLEVLTAQQALLQAQLSQVNNNLEKMNAVIELYRALGGGSNEAQPIAPKSK
ncbi:MAG: efflux transporter outer membrane subunit [Bacteroidales bacterium]